jgi:hypothetical protein
LWRSLIERKRPTLERARIDQRVIREKSEGNKSGRKVFALSFHSLRH